MVNKNLKWGEALIKSEALNVIFTVDDVVFQRHHLTQTMAILNTDGCNIFQSMGNTVSDKYTFTIAICLYKLYMGTSRIVFKPWEFQ